MTNTQTRVLDELVAAISEFANASYEVDEYTSDKSIVVTISATNERNSARITLCVGPRGGLYATNFGGKVRYAKKDLIGAFAIVLW